MVFSFLRSTFTVFILLNVVSTKTTFAESDNFPKYRVNVFQIMRSGDKSKSFAESTPGMGAEVMTTTMGSVVNAYVKGRLGTQSGSQTFLDSGVATKASFTYYQGAVEVGSTLYPIPRKKEGLNVYALAGGILSYNYISLDKAVTFTALTNNEQAMGFGYSAAVGAEFYPGHNKWTLAMEFGYRTETANLTKQSSFNLGGFVANFGFGW